MQDLGLFLDAGIRAGNALLLAGDLETLGAVSGNRRGYRLDVDAEADILGPHGGDELVQIESRPHRLAPGLVAQDGQAAVLRRRAEDRLHSASGGAHRLELVFGRAAVPGKLDLMVDRPAFGGEGDDVPREAQRLPAVAAAAARLDVDCLRFVAQAEEQGIVETREQGIGGEHAVCELGEVRPRFKQGNIDIKAVRAPDDEARQQHQSIQTAGPGGLFRLSICIHVRFPGIPRAYNTALK